MDKDNDNDKLLCALWWGLTLCFISFFYWWTLHCQLINQHNGWNGQLRRLYVQKAICKDSWKRLGWKNYFQFEYFYSVMSSEQLLLWLQKNSRLSFVKQRIFLYKVFCEKLLELTKQKRRTRLVRFEKPCTLDGTTFDLNAHKSLQRKLFFTLFLRKIFVWFWFQMRIGSTKRTRFSGGFVFCFGLVETLTQYSISSWSERLRLLRLALVPPPDCWPLLANINRFCRCV